MIMAALIETTTPLEASQVYVSPVKTVQRAINISGTVFSNTNGTLYVEQSGDGTDFDVSSSYSITGGTGEGFEIPLVAQHFRIRFANEGAKQSAFRIFAEARDPYGLFLQSPGAPSSGGAWMVLYFNPSQSKYEIINRFEAVDGFDANGQAAISTNKDGKYASFLVAEATVSDETLSTTSEHLPTTF